MLGCGAGSRAAGLPNTAYTDQDLAAHSPAPLAGWYTVVYSKLLCVYIMHFHITIMSVDLWLVAGFFFFVFFISHPLN